MSKKGSKKEKEDSKYRAVLEVRMLRWPHMGHFECPVFIVVIIS
jgi:hypothetical protein